jgi:hypothetical protein
MKFRAWLPATAACAIAVGRAVSAAAPEGPPTEMDEATRRAAFRAVASEETAMRREAAKHFPTDLWSQDDDFHERELRRARDWANAHRARLGDVLSALDEGMRAHWPHDNPRPLVTTVPPCRPRAIY